MKKLLCVLMFGMVFGQTDVSSKLIEYSVTVEDEYLYIPIQEMVGFELDRGTIEFAGFEGSLESFLNIKYFSSNADQYGGGIGNSAYEFNIDSQHQAVSESGSPSYYFDSNIDYISFYFGGVGQFSGTVYFIVTAEFPEEDTGYIEEGFDYCIEEGANLIASPCRDSVPILDALPSEIANNLTGIIGAGVAATNEDGNWVGSLSGLGGGSGYWMLSNVNACFNYNCAEN